MALTLLMLAVLANSLGEQRSPLAAAPPSPRIFMPLAKDLSVTPAEVPIEANGPRRFIDVNGQLGYHPLSLATSLKIGSQLHFRPEGAIIVWVCPLESLGVSVLGRHVLSKDPRAHQYGILSDAFPVNDIKRSVFAWYWRSGWHPQMIAKFKSGAAGGAAAKYGVTPYVPVEHLSLHEREWYQFAFTWNKPASRFQIYVNGHPVWRYQFAAEGQTKPSCLRLPVGERDETFRDFGLRLQGNDHSGCRRRLRCGRGSTSSCPLSPGSRSLRRIGRASLRNQGRGNSLRSVSQ